MPSHQVRVQQNNCEHIIIVIESDLGKFKECIKCGKKVHISTTSEKS